MDNIVLFLYIQAMKEIVKHHGHSWVPPQECGIAIVQASETIGFPRRITGKIQHPFWVLDYCLGPGGNVRVNSEEQPWECRPPSVFHLYKPQTIYWEDTRALESNTYSLYILFDMNSSKILLRLLGESEKYCRIFDEGGILVSLLQKTADIGQKNGDNGFLKAQAVFFEILDYLVTAERIDAASFKIVKDHMTTIQNGLILNVREYLRQNINRNVSLHEIAQYTGVSVSTLTHSYPVETGETPLATHERLRINEIKNLLFKGEPLKVIAKILGFKDIYHLSKYFKRIEGVSPKKFLYKL